MKHSIDVNTVSDRIKYLMKINGDVKAYKVCKETEVPEGTFSRSIRTPDTWKIQHLRRIADYFKVSLDYLITGNANNINERLRLENRALREEMERLKEKLATYEVIAKNFTEVSATKNFRKKYERKFSK